MKFLTSAKMREWAAALRREGVRGFIKRYGKRVLFWFVLIYLIRDTVLYILVPYLIAKGLISSFPGIENAVR